jgi:electron transfer flavoprotein alpha/beta subunit
MNIVVCIKQVPNVAEVPIDRETGSLIREGVPSIINPEDKNAIEEALRLREKHGGKVTIITMGPPQAEEALREALAMGADEAILLCDRAFAGADTLATSYTLGCAINRIRHFDLVLCGREAIDGNTAQVGPELAEYLKIPQITYAQKVEIEGDAIKVQRALEDRWEWVETKLPALVSVIRLINEPRIPAMDAVMDAYAKELAVWKLQDIGADPEMTGLPGSPTKTTRMFTPPPRGKGEMIEGSAQEMVQKLMARLKDKHLV